MRLASQGCDCFDQMLASIEDHENPLVPQKCDQGWRRIVGLNR